MVKIWRMKEWSVAAVRNIGMDVWGWSPDTGKVIGWVLRELDIWRYHESELELGVKAGVRICQEMEPELWVKARVRIYWNWEPEPGSGYEPELESETKARARVCQNQVPKPESKAEIWYTKQENTWVKSKHLNLCSDRVLQAEPSLWSRDGQNMAYRIYLACQLILFSLQLSQQCFLPSSLPHLGGTGWPR